MIRKSIIWFLAAVFLTSCAQATIEHINEPTQPILTNVVATETVIPTALVTTQPQHTPTSIWSTDAHPLQIEVMRKREYSGSVLTIEQTLNYGSVYNTYLVSCISDG